MSMQIDNQHAAPLEIDAAGKYILDAPAKALLLNALQRGAITEGELEILLRRTGKGDIGIRIVDTRPDNKQDWLRCDRGRAALEANCKTCGMAERCVYWREHRYLVEDN